MRQDDVQHRQGQRPQEDQEQVVAWQVAPEDLHRAAQPGRPRSEQVLRSPQPQGGVVDDEHQRKGGEQLEQFGRTVDRPQDDDFDQRSQDADDHGGRDDAAPKSEPAADAGRKRVSDVGPEHIEGPVRDVHDARHAEEERQAGGDKEKSGGRGEPIERLEQDGAVGHRRSPDPAPASRACPACAPFMRNPGKPGFRGEGGSARSEEMDRAFRSITISPASRRRRISRDTERWQYLSLPPAAVFSPRHRTEARKRRLHI